MKVFRLRQVMLVTGLARSTVYKLMASGSFPKSIGLGCRSVGWIAEEVEAWIEKRAECRD